MWVNLDSGGTKKNFRQDMVWNSILAPIRSSPSFIALDAFTLDTGDVMDIQEWRSALTPIIEGPGVFIVREKVTYMLEDPSTNGYWSISPGYTGQPGGWFEPLSFRLI